MRLALAATLLLSLLLTGPRVLANPGISLEVATNQDLYHSNTTSRVYIEARIQAPVSKAPASQSLRNVVFVLDRSGSMVGERMQALRKAVTASVALLAAEDCISIVSFGSEVETPLEASRRDQVQDLDTLLARIEPAGGAALYDALNQAAAQLRRYASPRSINQLILVTDGPATKGPREADDLKRLAELFARENIRISTIGLGPDFEEDRLASLARIGNGRFHYAEKSEALMGLLLSELLPRQSLAALDLELVFEFIPDCSKPEGYGPVANQIQGNMVSFRLPALPAGQEQVLLASALIADRDFRFRIARVRLNWTDPELNVQRTETADVQVLMSADILAVRKSANPKVTHSCVDALISKGLQEAISELDKGNKRRALRLLRMTREHVGLILEEIGEGTSRERLQLLDTFVSGLENRELGALDRKLLRSGLNSELLVPAQKPEEAETGKR